MRKMIGLIVALSVIVLGGLAACGYDCQSKCENELHLLFISGQGIVSQAVCNNKEVEDADTCKKCDAALSAAVSAPIERSTCD